MTFEEIQKILGETLTNEILGKILTLMQATPDAKDPDAHQRALCELLTALLAVLVVRGSGGTRLSRAELQSRRLVDLADTMETLALSSERRVCPLSLH